MATRLPRSRSGNASRCAVCGKHLTRSAASWPLHTLGASLLEYARRTHAQLSLRGRICEQDLDRLRSGYVQDSLRRESLLVVSIDVSTSDDCSLDAGSDSRTRGQRLSDAIASFGGSWAFLLWFSAVLGSWIVINGALLRDAAFDPPPFILLNLVLSCLAAIQAPIILMSQNRAAARDRERADHDYRVNLKAELEIRHLHEKVNHLLRLHGERELASVADEAVEPGTGGDAGR
jgi:uncharacterized membrane protein